MSQAGTTQSWNDGNTGNPSPQSRAEHPGETIGQYTLVSVLGEGGFGTVWEAQQAQPHRRVALKIIREGLTSPSLLRRFEAEAEILGRLQHPGIAQIYEAGTFDHGRAKQPFFAMELVEGLPLTRYAQEKGLSTRQRLDLLVKICDAVQHAHGRGIIHRDLKPANILVNDDGQPKVLDFGVARATDSDIKTTTLQTDIGQLIGTLSYMSPEQAGGDPHDLDTRSDVYALGVIAYELLAERMPYDLREKMIHEAVRIIREEEPSKLSTINRTLRGDLDVIIGKALAKEKERRYETAAAFAEDVERYQKDEPITARPPSTWYQLSKFSRRNKGLAGGIVAATLAILVGGITSFAFGLKQRRAKLEADKEAYIATLAAAAADLESGDATECQKKLHSCHLGLRGWEWRYLTGQSERQIVQYPHVGQTGPSTATISSSGKYAAVSTTNGEVDLRALADPSTVPSIHLHTGFDAVGLHVAFDPADRYIMVYATGYDAPLHNSLQLWTINGALERSIDIDGRHLFGACFSSSGNEVLTYGYSNTLCTWDTRTGHLVACGDVTLDNNVFFVRDAALDSSTHTLTALAYDGDVTHLSWPDMHVLSVCAKSNSAGMALTRSGIRTIESNVTMSGHVIERDGIPLRDGLTGALVAILGDHDGFPSSTRFSDDGSLAITGTSSEAKIWDSANGQLLAVVRNEPLEWSSIRRVGPNVIVTASLPDATDVRLVSLGPGTYECRTPSGSIEAMAFSPASGYLATLETNGAVRVWSHTLESHTLLNGITFTPWPYQYSLAFSPDGYVLVSGVGGTVQAWDMRTAIPVKKAQNWNFNFDRDDYEFTSLVFSDDGRYLAGWDGAEFAALWDTTTWNTIGAWMFSSAEGSQWKPTVPSLFSMRSEHQEEPELVSRNTNENVTIRLKEPAPPSTMTFMDVTGDGHRVRKSATALRERVLSICEADTKRELFRSSRFPSALKCICVSPDAGKIAVGSDDGRVWILDTSSAMRRLLALTANK